LMNAAARDNAEHLNEVVAMRRKLPVATLAPNEGNVVAPAGEQTAEAQQRRHRGRIVEQRDRVQEAGASPA
jgi:hypothetical protein